MVLGCRRGQSSSQYKGQSQGDPSLLGKLPGSKDSYTANWQLIGANLLHTNIRMADRPNSEDAAPSNNLQDQETGFMTRNDIVSYKVTQDI